MRDGRFCSFNNNNNNNLQGEDGGGQPVAGWEGRAVFAVGGVLRYPEYSFFKRFLLKRIAKQAGMPTDTSKVHEYTDWAKVLSFTVELLELATAGTLQHA